MAGVMEGVDQRTNLVGENRFELLLFGLGGKQKFGINVFKVQEVIQCPPLTGIPKAHRIVRGIANMRGRTITIMDLAMAIGRKPIDDIHNRFVIVTEYNRSTQGFLVSSVDFPDFPLANAGQIGKNVESVSVIFHFFYLSYCETKQTRLSGAPN